MKKALIYFASVAFLFACDDHDSKDVSDVTAYAEITVQGENLIILSQGETYVEPGVVAFEGDTEIPVVTTIKGKNRGATTLDTNIADEYLITYTATNGDGFSATSQRTVIVANTGDLVNSIEGLYTSTIYRNGAQGAPASAYTDMEYILIWKNSNGTYGISDAFGGWYLLGRAIAGSETPGGIIVANNIPNNDFTFPATLTNSYFGGSATITGMTVNPTNKTINFTSRWVADAQTTYTFSADLKQVQL